MYPRSIIVTALALAFLHALLVAGCLDPGSICGDGRCPANTVCDLVHARCVTPGQLVDCAGILDGTLCSVRSQSDGVCKGGVCILGFCGDGTVLTPEQCDGANLAGKTCADVDPGYHGEGHLGCTAQ